MLISTLVDYERYKAWPQVWQYMLISTLVDAQNGENQRKRVWQYMLISTLVDAAVVVAVQSSDSIC
mgnify:CR=1 FL=1